MAAMPEAKVVYPNAMNVHRSGAGTECRDGQWQPAVVEYTFLTNDSVHDVFAWYSQRLGPLGWSGATPDT